MNRVDREPLLFILLLTERTRPFGTLMIAGLLVSKFLVRSGLPAMSFVKAFSRFCLARGKVAHELILLLEIKEREAVRGTTFFFLGGFLSDVDEELTNRPD